jgi:endonuclease/exonuclease/phosphatase (EEP) superfamily protein YafD
MPISIGVLRPVSIAVLLALILGFFGAIDPLLDALGRYRVPLTVTLGIMTLLMVVRGQQMTALFTGVAVLFSMLTVLAYATIDAPRERPDLRMMQINTAHDNDLISDLARQIRAENPDIVTMQELSPDNQAIVDLLARSYPYSAVCALNGVGSVAVMSRFAFADGSMPYCDEGWGFVMVNLSTPDGEIKVGSLHIAPDAGDLKFQQNHRIAEYLADIEGEFVIAGDFNNTAWSHSLGVIANAARAEPAKGMQSTKRSMMGLFGFRMDHVLVPSGWQARTSVQDAPGSDHNAIVADIYVRG